MRRPPAVSPGASDLEHGRALLDERLSSEVLEYLRSGVEAGMVVPDASGTEVKSVRVVRQS
ncbi:hypothetical protein [Streptomyces scopuliridis]|uniref:hypothetical protein n=1 Tax=Streptomyces scopuliridis TaxID=452529 RepID=UPI0036A1CEF4